MFHTVLQSKNDFVDVISIDAMPDFAEHATPASRATKRELARSVELYASLNKGEKNLVSLYKYKILEGSVFVGHLHTDSDSVTTAVCAAALFGGVPALADASNDETKKIFDLFPKLVMPPLFSSLKRSQSTKICLVDHSQASQTPVDRADFAKVVAILDHHAIQSGIVETPLPILVDVRPWGSTATIVARCWLKYKRELPGEFAGALLCGILSDTLNLRSPTTTAMDELMVSFLQHVVFSVDGERLAKCGVRDVDDLARALFRAKSARLAHMRPHELVLGDHKVFTICEKYTVGIGVVETVEPSVVVERFEKDPRLFTELKAVRHDLKLDYSFFVVVDTLELQSILIVCGEVEKEVAEIAYGDVVERRVESKNDDAYGWYFTFKKGLVSRKKNFVPLFSSAARSTQLPPKIKDLHDYGELVVDPAPGSTALERSCSCTSLVRRPRTLKAAGLAVVAAKRFKLSAA